MTATKKGKIMTAKFKFVDYSDKLEGTILSVKKDGEKLRNKIHSVVLSIFKYMGKTKDFEGGIAHITSLLEFSGYHGKAVANYLQQATPLQYAEDTDKWYLPADAKINGEAFVQLRDGKTFWEVSPPPKATPFLGIVVLENLIQKNTTKASNPDKLKEGDQLLDAGTMALLREALAKAKSAVAA